VIIWPVIRGAKKSKKKKKEEETQTNYEWEGRPENWEE